MAFLVSVVRSSVPVGFSRCANGDGSPSPVARTRPSAVRESATLSSRLSMLEQSGEHLLVDVTKTPDSLSGIVVAASASAVAPGGKGGKGDKDPNSRPSLSPAERDTSLTSLSSHGLSGK
jgi:hypothetical protein